VLHPEDVAKRRKSSSYDAVWNEHPAAMWEKSAGRDLFAQLGLAEGDSAIQRMLAADDLAHGDAATALYGPPPVDTPALPAGDVIEGTSTTSTTSETAGADGDNQQAAAADEHTTLESAAAVPDPDFADAGDDEFITAAQEASGFVVPFGTACKDKTLADVHAAGATGEAWFAKMLEKVDPARYPEFRTALWAFTRVYLPDTYQAALEREEAQAAA
jgi:hypothetical protein